MPTAVASSMPKLDWDARVELERVSQLVSTDDPRARGLAVIRPLHNTEYNDHTQHSHYRINFMQGDKMAYSAYVRVRWLFAGQGWEPKILDLSGEALRPFGSKPFV